MANNSNEPLDLNYSPDLFVQMMEFLREKLSNFAPYTSHFGGYTYVFKTSADKLSFDRLVETNEDEAMRLVFDRWKEGSNQIMNIELTSGYRNTVLTGQKGVEIVYTFYTLDGSAKTYEPVTVNYTFECNGVRQSIQEQYAAMEEVHLNIDNYLLEGTNTVTVAVRGNNTKVSSTLTITYVLTDLSVDSNFNVSKAYGENEDMGFDVVARGVSDSGDLYVEYYIDGRLLGEMKVTPDEIGMEKRLSIEGERLPVEPGKHNLQLRTRATIGNANRYSHVYYYEYVRRGAAGQIVTIARRLADENILLSSSSLTLLCERYVPEVVKWGFYSSSAGDRATITWALIPVSGGDAVNVGSAEISNNSITNDGQQQELAFLPSDMGQFYLRAMVNGYQREQYDVRVSANSSGLEETTTELKCRLFAIGRSNSEPESERSVWKYKNVETTFHDVQWNGLSGWINNALVLSEGASAEINIQPFVGMSSASNGCTVEIEFETFGSTSNDAVVMRIGDRIVIKSNSASLESPTSHSVLTDNFPLNQRIKLAFAVHPKNSQSQPKLMEIINGGVTSRCTGYQDADVFTATDRIVLGGTRQCGIRVYSIRTYQIGLTNKQELNNVIVTAEDIAAMVRNNDIYNGNAVDVNKIKNRIPCLWITGHGGTDVLDSIWSSQAKVQIHVDAEWTNPTDGGRTNWRCTDMRLRSHGQSTLRNPLKSLKMWFKTESGQNVHNTEFFYPADNAEPMLDPRWSIRQGAMPQSKFVAQCYYIDSSNCKSPALMNIIDETMRAAGIFTPPMRYAIEQYPKDMKARYGEDPTGRGWKFPYDIRYTPDSIAAVVVSRATSQDPWHFDGIFVLMDDKKSDYLYGERSIYDCPNDPFCFDHDKADYDTLWDNSEVTRFEYLSNTHPISVDQRVDGFFGPRQSFTPDDDEQDVTTTPGGGEITGGSEDEGDRGLAPMDFEQSVELIYPDIDDLSSKKKWPGNYVNLVNQTDDTVHANRFYIYKKWLNDCKQAWQGGDGYAKFQAEAEQHMDLEQWAAYYCFAMPNGTFDNIVRNRQDTTFGKGASGYHIWLPLWWDIDIQDGTINTGQLAFMPPVSRETETAQYGVAFRGKESWLWDALEAWPRFTNLCRTTMNKLSDAGYTYDKIISTQDDYCNTWPEAMYNESQNYKYKQMYLQNTASNARYLYYLLGDGKTFRRWWLKKNWDYWMARLAAGDFAKNGVAVRWNGGSATVKVTYGDNTFFGWMLGDDMQMIEGRYSKEVNRGDEISFSPSDTSNSIYTTVFSSQYILKADYTRNARNLLNVSLQHFRDAVTGSMLEEMRIGIADDELRSGARNGASGIFEGWGSLTSLKVLQIQGFTAGEVIDLSASQYLTEVYAKGSSYTGITFPDSVTLTRAELPTTLTYMDMRFVKFENLSFHKPNDPFGTTYEYPLDLTNASFTGMGQDDKVKRLVFAWLKANRQNLGRLTLTATALKWDHLDYDDVLLLGGIPAAQRNLEGIVKIETVHGVARTLNTDEMNTLIGIFNDPERGINVFSTSSSFQIDCASGFILTGPTSILAGGIGKIVAAVFPLTAGDYVYTFSIVLIDGKPASSFGVSQSGATQTYNGTTLNRATGEITTTESYFPTCVLTIQCNAVSGDGNNTQTGSIDVEIKARTYPASITIDGATIIGSTGRYEYNAVTIPAQINGTLTSHKWQNTQLPNMTLLSDTARTLALRVDSLTDDYEMTISYNASYKNNQTITAPSVTVKLIAAAYSPILTLVENREAMLCIAEHVRQNAAYTLANNNAVQRIEAMQFNELPASLANNSELLVFYQVKWFVFIRALDLHGDVNLTGEIDCRKLERCESINLTGTYADCLFGSPLA